MFRTTCVVFTIFLFSFIHGKPRSYAVPTNNLQDTFEYVENLYQSFIILGNNTLTDGHNRLNNVRSETLKLEDQTQFVVKSELGAITAAFLQEIVTAETQAGQYGISIDDCVGDSKIQITNLPDQAVSAIFSCIYTPKNKIISDIANTSNSIDVAFHNWINVFSTELQQCKTEAESLQAACASTLGTEISQVKSSFPTSVHQQVAIIEGEFQLLTKEYVQCSTNQIAAVSDRASTIVSEVVGCANERFFTATTTTSTTPVPTPPPSPAPETSPPSS